MVRSCVHEMCSKEKCLLKEDQSIYQKLCGRFSTKDDSTKHDKVRLPSRIDRENFKDRVEKIFKKYQKNEERKIVIKKRIQTSNKSSDFKKPLLHLDQYYFCKQ